MFAFGGNTGGNASIFGQHLAPGGGTSTGTSKYAQSPSGLIPRVGNVSLIHATGSDSPFTFGGASSFGYHAGNGDSEPGTENEDTQAKKAADGDDEQQAQISLTKGGPGEEDESVVHEVRAKALSSSQRATMTKTRRRRTRVPGRSRGRWTAAHPQAQDYRGPCEFSSVRSLAASIAMNKAILPSFTYKPEANGGKYVKITTSNHDGSGLETWMLTGQDSGGGEGVG